MSKPSLDAIGDPAIRIETDDDGDEQPLRSDKKGREDTELVVTALFAQQNIHENPAFLREVSSHDREVSLYDVHGVLKPIEENPAFIEEKMMHLVAVLLLDVEPIERTLRELYGQTSHDFPEYTSRLLLSCLRAERFDVDKASSRVLRHIQTKHRLFGADSVGRDLGVKDLGALERQALDDGVVQILHTRDRSGRTILAQFKSVAEKYPPEVVVRFYCLEVGWLKPQARENFPTGSS